MEVTTLDVAHLLDGLMEDVPAQKLSGFSGIEDAAVGDLTFLANPSYEAHLYTTNATAVLVSKGFVPTAPLKAGTQLIRVDDPYAAMAKLMQAYGNQEAAQPQETFIHPSAVVAETAQIEAGVHIGPLCTVGANSQLGAGTRMLAGSMVGKGCHIGKAVTLGMRSVVADQCTIGDHCTLQIGAIIGADGFGFAPTDEGYEKIPQLGTVTLGPGCEIGAGTTIDRATLGETVLGKGVKLDNLIQVAHNVRIGDHTVIAAQTGIAGSTSIGAHCMIGGQVGINGHIQIADGTKIAAKSGITASIKATGQVMQGNPAQPIKQHQRMQLALRKLAKEFTRNSQGVGASAATSKA
ncbi:MAG: UDP-3-O-(3-hydroxymyristoyl)glucosamine N-acyltransferase [Flavobacteriales bacterium]|nr:UDP-3-O-(3-hydroxymyristoyl)glucosamine N-acyltransferase [Flavobacteriales bacterium]